ncbi:MAG: FIST signal transduction protein [Phormidesmis sp.]
MFKMIVGHSADVDSEDAISDVLTQCINQLESEQQPQAGILLAAIDFDHPLILSRIQDTFPNMALIGGTTDGEVSSVMGFQEDSLTLMVFCSDTVEIRAGLGRGLSKDAISAAEQSVATLGLDDLTNAKLCITIPDGVEDGTEPALRQLQKLLPAGLPIVGGRAGDQFQFESTYQFFQGEVLQNGFPILLFFGDLNVSHGVACGWQPLSRRAVITKSDGPTIYEIDGQPATDFYQEYLGDDLPISGEYPLAIFEKESDRFYLRASNSWDLEAGSMLFMGEMPEQAEIQITYTTCDLIVAAAQESIEQAIAHYPGQKPAAALFFSCAARRWLLGHRTKDEYALGQQFIDETTPIGGFYTYGEIGPLKMGGETRYHQETLVTVLFGTE